MESGEIKSKSPFSAETDNNYCQLLHWRDFLFYSLFFLTLSNQVYTSPSPHLQTRSLDSCLQAEKQQIGLLFFFSIAQFTHNVLICNVRLIMNKNHVCSPDITTQLRCMFYTSMGPLPPPPTRPPKLRPKYEKKN